jgi:hypothetical protein
VSSGCCETWSIDINLNSLVKIRPADQSVPETVRMLQWGRVSCFISVMLNFLIKFYCYVGAETVGLPNVVVYSVFGRCRVRFWAPASGYRDWGFSLFYSVHLGECRDSTLKLDHDRFLLNPFRFIIHLSSCHLCYIVQLLMKRRKINHQPTYSPHITS